MSGSFAAAVAADRASRSSGGESSGYDSPAPSGVNLTVFLTSAGRIKKCQWTGGSWKELDALYRRTFAEGRAKRFWADAGIGTGAFAPLRKELFMLRDRHYGIFYEDFDLDDLYDGAVIEVRTHTAPNLLLAPPGLLCTQGSGGVDSLRLSHHHSEITIRNCASHVHCFAAIPALPQTNGASAISSTVGLSGLQ
jgi:hypothetical protein